MNQLIVPWSVTSAVVRDQRDQLINFWISCPDDLLESIWSGPTGQVTREMIAQLSPTFYFTENQVAIRNRLGEFLQAGFHQPGAVKAILCTFLLSPPGQFRILNPESHLPAWLVPAYRSLYETGTSLANSTNVSPTPALSSIEPPKTLNINPSTPDFGAFPETLADFVSNRLQLNRLLGLSNLYYIDPDDQEIKNELLTLRSQLAELMLKENDATFEGLFASDFGDRYWSLVRSGIQSIPLDSSLDDLRLRLKEKLSPEKGGGFGTPGSIAAFLVAMMLYQPGTMQVEDAERKLPSWLLQGYNDVFASAIN